MKVKRNKKPVGSSFSQLTRMLVLFLTFLMVFGPVASPFAAMLNNAKFNATTDLDNSIKLYEFKINPPKNGTYTDKRTGFQVTVNFDYQKGKAKNITWSSNYPVYSVLVKGGEKGGNVFKYEEGAMGGTEVITPDNEGVGHGHATFYYSIPNSNQTEPGETDSAVPGDTDPAVPGETDPAVPGETDPAVPGETDPSVPGETDPAVPGETDPAVPGETDPAVPGETDPAVPGETDPVVPGETDPAVPGETDPAVPGETDPAVPGETDPVVPVDEETVVEELSIVDISQIEGLITGGDYVTVTGIGFQKGLTATLGGINATVVNYNDTTQIRIAIPQGLAEGVVDLEITNPDGQVATLESAYTYLPLPAAEAPTITSLSVNSGLISGGEYVTVYGTGFQKGLTGNLGGLNAVVVNYYSETQIRIAIPQTSTEGVVDLTVTNPDGQMATLIEAYTYLPLPATPAPTITSLAKTSGLTSGGDYVVVNGTGFQKGITVKLGGLDAQVANYYSSTQIRIIIPKTTGAGVVDLEVTNPDGQGAILNDAYTYIIPVTTLDSLSATSGEFAGGYYIFLNGTNFDPSSTVTVNGVPVTIYYYGSTQIKIMSMPSGDALGLSNDGGVVPIKVTDSFGDSVSANFTYKAKPATPVPHIDVMNGAGGVAATGSISGGTYVYFYGIGFTSTMKVRVYDSLNNLVKEEAITNFYNSGYARYLMPKVTTAGNYTVKLVNIDGVESNGMIYIYE